MSTWPTACGAIHRPPGADESQVRAWYPHWVDVAFASLEEMLLRRPASQRFAFADYPTIAEACLVPQMDNARRFDCDVAPYPHLVAVDAECR